MTKVNKFHDSNETGETLSTMYADLYGAIQLKLWINKDSKYTEPEEVAKELKSFIDSCEDSTYENIQQDFAKYFTVPRLEEIHIFTDYYDKKSEGDDALAILAFCNMVQTLHLHFDKDTQCNLFKKNIQNYNINQGNMEIVDSMHIILNMPYVPLDDESDLDLNLEFPGFGPSSQYL